MVSIRKAKQTSFKLRRKGRRGAAYDAEKVGLVAAGLCIGFLVMFMYNVAFSEINEGENKKHPILESLRKTKKHPVLMETSEDGDGEKWNENGNNRNHEHLDHPPIKHVRPMDDSLNAIALDIQETLGCVKFLKEAEESLVANGGNTVGMDDFAQPRRRLQQHADDGGFANFGEVDGGISQVKDEKDGRDDDAIPEEQWGNLLDRDGDKNPLKDDDSQTDPNLRDDIGEFNGYGNLSAKHLFCVAATENPPEAVTKEISCDGSKLKRKSLLELWSEARPKLQLDLILNVLSIAQEREETILNKAYNIWAPAGDKGIEYMVNTLNSDTDVDNGGLNGLESALGPGKIFLDVGGCLGLTCLVINDKYPGTKIVSFEPASPNWLLQEINLRCNLRHEEFKKVRIVMAGVGANTEEEETTMRKLMWRPTSTTSTRSWTPASEFQEDDVELVVALRKLKSILAEAEVIKPNRIDVMNLDCQGCEYDLIPALTTEEFDEIPTIMGSVHWGYMDPSKLPSSARGRTTHERLCQHENVARSSKECCAFPDLPVKSSIPGEILQKDDTKEFPPRAITVSDVIADNLCDDFSTWAMEHYLDEVPDDFNWFYLSSQAEK
mmetsp:Transcript_18326/g.42218  ORF Transcript_18326/g.42218 Transcript_18326/m.42218 type:complete len:608 (-) Transcript_18326:59-1882(-)